MRFRQVVRLLLFLGGLPVLSSCGTVASLVNQNETKVFGGVIYDTAYLIPNTNHDMWVGWIFIPDLPLSLGMDIILLPVTIVWEATRGSKLQSDDPP